MFSCTWSVSIVFDLFCKVCWDHVSRWFCTLNEPIDWLITGHFSGTEARDSPYLHPGSVEVYRERGGAGSGNRGRSGRESPRSAVSSSHHRSQKQLRLPRLVCWDVVWNISHISCFLFFFFQVPRGRRPRGTHLLPPAELRPRPGAHRLHLQTGGAAEEAGERDIRYRTQRQRVPSFPVHLMR